MEYLHRLDPARNECSFIRTTEAELRRASFLDHRACLSGRITSMPVDLLPVEPRDRLRKARLMIHVGFCGSTHLSRLLESGGATLVLREPQALTDLANYQAAIARQDAADAMMPGLLADAIALLSRPWRRGSPVIVKPSNWANVLLSQLEPGRTRVFAIVSPLRQHLRALLRGGPERLAFAGRAAVHFSSGETEAAHRIFQVLAEPWEVTEKLLLLGGIAHALQLEMIRDALARMPSAAAMVEADTVLEQPMVAVARAARVLDVPQPTARDVSQALDPYSKDPTRQFDIARQIEIDAEIERRHSRSLDRVERWLGHYASRA